MKFGLEALTGKALSVCLEFICEVGEKVFCLQVQINCCINYLADFSGKLKTNKFNSFLQNGFNYKKNS